MALSPRRWLLLVLGVACFVALARKLYRMYRRREGASTPKISGSAVDVAPQSDFENTKKAPIMKGSKVPQRSQKFIESVRLLSADVAATDDDLLRLFPRRFERHDHVVVVKLNPGVQQAEFTREVAAAFASSFEPQVVDVVVVDVEGIAGELRKPVHTIAYVKSVTDFDVQRKLFHKVAGKRYKNKTPSGDAISDGDVALFDTFVWSPTFTVHVENGVRYCFDVMKVMFCSGNTTERMHFAEVDATGELVVDMFAGIGYFTLPLALHGNVKKIIALEKNPDSCGFLRFNALLNEVGDTVEIHQGDNREATGNEYTGKCDRVLMGYIPTCEVFIPRAASFLRIHPATGHRLGIIHYHVLAGERKEDAYRCTFTHFTKALGEDAASREFAVGNIRQVKSYGPRVFHYVVDVHFGPQLT